MGEGLKRGGVEKGEGLNQAQDEGNEVFNSQKWQSSF